VQTGGELAEHVPEPPPESVQASPAHAASAPQFARQAVASELKVMDAVAVPVVLVARTVATPAHVPLVPELQVVSVTVPVVAPVPAGIT
jgi:hypothetical protein